MTTKQAAKTLIQFNKWRRSNDDNSPPYPEKVGQAIDKAIDVLSRFTTTRPIKKTKL